mgnify:CR=1 FL=1
MRVEDRLRTNRETVRTERVKANRRIESSPFLKVLHREQQASTNDEIERLMQKLDEQAERLTHSRTLIDLNLYKKYVHQILERTIGNGIGLVEKRIDTYGRTRIYRTVQEINAELVSLTDEVLKRETSRLDILRKVGQIKGLLIQLQA